MSCAPPQRVVVTPTSTTHREETATMTEMSEGSEILVVYTDGSKRQRGSGIGIFFEDNHPLNQSIPLDVDNSGVAEIMAVQTALVIILEWKEYKRQSVVVRTDYMGIIEAMKRETYGRKKRFSELYADLRRLVERFPSVTFEHVYGHNGVRGNEMADRIARRASWMKEREFFSTLYSMEVRSEMIEITAESEKEEEVKKEEDKLIEDGEREKGEEEHWLKRVWNKLIRLIC